LLFDFVAFLDGRLMYFRYVFSQEGMPLMSRIILAMSVDWRIERCH